MHARAHARPRTKWKTRRGWHARPRGVIIIMQRGKRGRISDRATYRHWNEFSLLSQTSPPPSLGSFRSRWSTGCLPSFKFKFSARSRSLPEMLGSESRQVDKRCPSPLGCFTCTPATFRCTRSPKQGYSWIQ